MTTLAPQDAYRMIADVYDAAPNPVRALEARLLAPLLLDLKGQRVIDAASGTGRWAKYCTAHGADAVAIDLSWEMLMRGPRPAVQANTAELPVRDDFADVVICALSLSYAPECFGELARIVRPGGSLFVSDVHPEAMRRGWNRGFRSNGVQIEAAHRRYEIEDLGHPTLARVDLVEASFGDPERHIFEATGKRDNFEALSDYPAVFAAQWRKRC